MRDTEKELVEEALNVCESDEVNGYGAVLLLKQAGASNKIIEIAEGALEGEANAKGVRQLVMSYLKALEEAQDPGTSKERLSQLQRHENPEVRKAAMENPGARNL